MSIYCATFVQGARLNFPPIREPGLTYTAYMWRGIYNGLDMVVFVIVAAILGLGGLEQEREAGSAGFTLALPVSRARLLWPRVAVAMFEMTALAAIPLLVVPWVSASIGHEYPVIHALRFAILFAITGTLWVSAGVLVSVAVSGNSAAIVASLLTPAVCAAVFSTLRSHAVLSPFNVMNGSRLSFVNPITALPEGPLPWAALLSFVAMGAVVLSSASALSARRDF
jgi:ABC-type transport system involved in multi-copper enzyme maturation permease subunit